MQRMPPTLGTVAGLELVTGVELPPDALAERLSGSPRASTWSSIAGSSRSAVGSSTSSGIARRPARLEYWGDEVERLREFSPSTQLSTAQLPSVRVTPVRELLADDAVRAVAAERARGCPIGSPTSCNDSPTGSASRASDTLSPFLFEDLRTPAALLPSGAWVAVTQAPDVPPGGAGRTRRPRRSPRRSSGRVPASSRRWRTRSPGAAALHLSEFAGGLDLRIRGWGTAEGNLTELAA